MFYIFLNPFCSFFHFIYSYALHLFHCLSVLHLVKYLESSPSIFLPHYLLLVAITISRKTDTLLLPRLSIDLVRLSSHCSFQLILLTCIEASLSRVSSSLAYRFTFEYSTEENHG